MYKFMCNLKAIKNQNISKNLEQAFNNLLNTDSLSCSLVVIYDSVAKYTYGYSLNIFNIWRVFAL